MQVYVLVNQKCLEDAIEAASALGQTEPLEGLRAPLDGAASGMLSTIWEYVTNAIRVGYERGVRDARPLLDDALAKAQEILNEAGSAARDIREALRERLQKLVRNYIDNVLATLSPRLTFGDRQLDVQSVSVEHKVILGGDVALSIENAFKIAASGEFKVSANYG